MIKERSTQKQRHASPQQQLSPVGVTLDYLFLKREKFETYPEFQRGECWSTRKMQALIDTILNGDPIPALEGYQQLDATGEMFWGMVDGHQRISTILKFMDGVFETWTAGQKKRTEPNSLDPVEPGKTFHQLDPVARSYFLDYTLYINRIRQKSPREMANRFLRLQNHEGPTPAEKLNIYRSTRTNMVAHQIENHPFWHDFYVGGDRREQIFQCCLYLLLIELTSTTIIDLQAWSSMHAFAAGKKDALITDECFQSVMRRLDMAAHLYRGTVFSLRPVVVLMYQSVKFLEEDGYTIQKSQRGCLSNWMTGLIYESTRQSGVPNYVTPIQRILRESKQREFWDKHRDTLFSLASD